MKPILEADLPHVLRAHVVRNDPTRGLCTDVDCPTGPYPTGSRCSDGLCPDGPHVSGGFTWTVTLTTQWGNVSPRSPTDPLTTVEGLHRELLANDGGLSGFNARVTIVPSHGLSAFQRMAALNATIPFSLAYGGGGAGYGGRGGPGYGDNFGSGTAGLVYGDKLVGDLMGGSGGQMGYLHPYSQNAFTNPTGRGGHGGAAIELVAVNDITIGAHGIVNVSAGDGQAGHVSGGGGGSGGAILLSAGGVIVNDGQLIARGGDGGLAGDISSDKDIYQADDVAGGAGGGGGRIAIFGQAYRASDDTVVEAPGGYCRAWAEYEYHSNGTAAEADWPMGPENNIPAPPWGGPNGAWELVNGTWRFDDYRGDNTTNVSTAIIYPRMNVSLTKCRRHGDEGSVHIETQYGMRYSVETGEGVGNNETAAGVYGTRHSLKLESDTRLSTDSDVIRRAPFSYNGPEYDVTRHCAEQTAGNDHRTTHPTHTSTNNCERPERVSYFVKVDGSDARPKDREGSWGAMFVLWPTVEGGTSYPDGEPIGAGFNGSSWDGLENDTDIMLGVSLTNTFRYGANFNFQPGDLEYYKHLPVFEPYAQEHRWYKVDLLLNWDVEPHEFDIRLDDVPVVSKGIFTGDGVGRVGLYNYHELTTWFDEIYLGDDDTMDFRAPEVTRRGVKMDRPMQTGWKAEDIGERSYNHPMQRHVSHITKRDIYDYNNGGLVPFDGDGQRAYNSDIRQRFANGDRHEKMGGLKAGALLYVAGTKVSDETLRTVVTSQTVDHATAADHVLPSARHQAWSFGARGDGATDLNGNHNADAGSSGTYYWYGEHSFKAGAAHELGGIACASTDDLVTWRNEGIMLHYANITDMVYGTKGPFVVERPKVIYNAKTSKYVMWLNIDNEERTLGLAGVAISDYANGPFDFLRSFFPDGNRTRDQTIWRSPDGRAFLGRTYYTDVEYILPEAVMQPLWSAVKMPTDDPLKDGETDFSLSYHRTFYSSDYDNYHDIYLQRWRDEDIPWKVKCVNRVTGVSYEVPRYDPAYADKSTCVDPDEYKVIEGQGSDSMGNPMGIPSRFKDPMDPANSAWLPNSVPGVKSQPWKYNYMDGEVS